MDSSRAGSGSDRPADVVTLPTPGEDPPDGSSATALRSVGLTKRYRRGFQLGPVDLVVGPGITCLVGANGAGKSTLFRLWSGLEAPGSGSVRLEAPGRPGPTSAVGYLPQRVDLPGNATARTYLHYVAWLYGIPRAGRDAAVEEVLATVGLVDRADERIGRLSGGMRRRVGFAHAVLHSPQLLLLDEPTVGLDPLQRVRMRETIAAASTGRIIVVSTHLVDDVEALADRVIVLADGAVTFDGSVPELARLAPETGPGVSAVERAVSLLMVGVTPTGGAA